MMYFIHEEDSSQNWEGHWELKSAYVEPAERG